MATSVNAYMIVTMARRFAVRDGVRTTEDQIPIHFLAARSQAEATGLAYQQVLEGYPPDDGWTDHKITLAQQITGDGLDGTPDDGIFCFIDGTDGHRYALRMSLDPVERAPVTRPFTAAEGGIP